MWKIGSCPEREGALAFNLGKNENLFIYWVTPLNFVDHLTFDEDMLSLREKGNIVISYKCVLFLNAFDMSLCISDIKLTISCCM